MRTLLVVLLVGSAQALAHPPCPKEYSKELLRPGAPPGWKATVRDNYQLRVAAAMDGPVEGRAFLKPYPVREFKNGYVEVYDLERVDDKWFWCGYGMDANLLLSRKLPPSTKSCKVTYKRTIPALKNYYEVVEVSCK